MNKKPTVPLLIFALLIGFASTGFAQITEQVWLNSVTLPDGEVILDMSGEWDVVYEKYGPFSGTPTLSDIVSTTQEGNTFTAIKKIGTLWVPKGEESIKGKLNRSGFEEVFTYIGAYPRDGSFVWESCKWEVTENGNKVMLDCGERVKVTLTRK